MVKPKKHLGQHFLTDLLIAQQIAESLSLFGGYKAALEIGAGMGVLTQYLIQNPHYQTYIAEIDRDSVAYLHKHFAQLKPYISEGDFLQMNLDAVVPREVSDKVGIIGNFPYNISSQIFFKVLAHKDRISEVVGMLQKEVAERLAAPAGSRESGVLSIFLQAYYDIEYLFTVEAHVFEPPPQVRSGVIRLKRNATVKLDCDEQKFQLVVKTAFNQRRKTLRNALKPLLTESTTPLVPYLDKRAEQLTIAQFVEITNILS
jgi:16S rRNA (adenine1518-N6/adenine1519-N6)-dimethyltransferase